jgi:hypothetical protein
MALVDTSVWVRLLAGREPYAAELDRLLGLDEVTGHELVYGELLIGGMGADWAGSTSTCRHPLSLGDCSYGRPIRACRKRPIGLASLTTAERGRVQDGRG